MPIDRLEFIWRIESSIGQITLTERYDVSHTSPPSVITGLLSVHEWKGAIEEDAESLLVIKTREDRFRALEATIREVHPYETF